MKFKKYTEDNKTVLISGIYKIVPYDHIQELSGRPGYAAYYKPKGWKFWGNHVNKHRPFYLTVEGAKKACLDHASIL